VHNPYQHHRSPIEPPVALGSSPSQHECFVLTFRGKEREREGMIISTPWDIIIIVFHRAHHRTHHAAQTAMASTMDQSSSSHSASSQLSSASESSTPDQLSALSATFGVRLLYPASISLLNTSNSFRNDSKSTTGASTSSVAFSSSSSVFSSPSDYGTISRERWRQ